MKWIPRSCRRATISSAIRPSLRLAAPLDDEFRIPGIATRFGLDPRVGLIPGFGDAIGGIVGLVFVFAAFERSLPCVTVARMIANILIDTLGGTLPSSATCSMFIGNRTA